jgi:uncharacterized protein YkvS
MNDPEDNLLLRLHKWARRQDENFHTEVLVHLLRHLLQHEPIAATRFLKEITGERLDLSPEDAISVSVATQVKTSKGYKPDIEIRTLAHLIYIEVKVESELRNRQLEDYRKALNESGLDKTTLILLTRYSFISKEKQGYPDILIRWHQITEWLKYELDQNMIQQSSSIYVVEQFIEFLRGRGTIMEKVNEELIVGVRSLRNFMDILHEAITSTKVVYPSLSSTKIVFDSDDYGYYMGYNFKFKSKPYWMGIYDIDPHILIVSTEDEIDEKIYEGIGIGYIGDDGCWIHERDLSSNERQFFKLSLSDQLKDIETFLSESLNAVSKI